MSLGFPEMAKILKPQKKGVARTLRQAGNGATNYCREN